MNVFFNFAISLKKIPYYSTEKQNLSLLGDEIQGKVREEYEILNPDKIAIRSNKVRKNPVTA
ncbi:hypothetical protein [Leptospira interrogans]|uniref:hypothetical protein n=1 Tax=Leptospira interrogans TaxID=173 RepID=UPI0002BF1D88|nr:hypothetical protein [Leptospira interrogans]AKH76254.1 hypothetical protein BRAT_03770 [Leptospira interrogans serovar Bratislava]EMN07795.1 hypothetical protein LEP1GSC053_0177 [Leptospira interrogans serovar Muenchen str. Brem 129]